MPQLLGELYSAAFVKRNPFLIGESEGDASQIVALQAIPGVGENKARVLAENFGSLERIAVASESDLALVVGSSAARELHSFFNDKKR